MPKMKVKDLAKLSIEELEELNQKYDEEMQALRQEKKVVADVLSEKVLEDQALRRLETMSDEEKRVLLQHVQAEGIKSSEKVGTPGEEDEGD